MGIPEFLRQPAPSRQVSTSRPPTTSLPLMVLPHPSRGGPVPRWKRTPRRGHGSPATDQYTLCEQSMAGYDSTGLDGTRAGRITRLILLPGVAVTPRTMAPDPDSRPPGLSGSPIPNPSQLICRCGQHQRVPVRLEGSSWRTRNQSVGLMCWKVTARPQLFLMEPGVGRAVNHRADRTSLLEVAPTATDQPHLHTLPHCRRRVHSSAGATEAAAGSLRTDRVDASWTGAVDPAIDPPADRGGRFFHDYR